MAQSLYFFQRNHVLPVKRPDAGAPQRANMAERAQFTGQIAGQRADIGAFSAPHFKARMIGIGQAEKLEGLDFDPARAEREILPGAGQAVGSFARDPERGIARRHLLDDACKPWQDGFDFVPFRPLRDLVRDRPFAIIGIRGYPPAHRECIVFRPVLNERYRLGGLSQRDRQQAGGHGIESSAMAGLARVERCLDKAERAGRCHGDGLVQNNPAVDMLASPFSRHGFGFSNAGDQRPSEDRGPLSDRSKYARPRRNNQKTCRSGIQGRVHI